MKSAKEAAPTNLSPAVAEACRVRGVRQCVGNLVKAVLFWAITLALLFITESQNDVFTRETQPFWFALILIVLILYPFVKWKPYRILLERDFRGTIVSYRNKRVMDHTGEDSRGPFFDRGKLGAVDVYIIHVVSESGQKRTFTIKRANTEFGRVYYQKGDVVRCPRFANLPFNESRPLPRPYCIWCGSIGSPNETECKCCHSPYSLIPEKDEFIPLSSTATVEKTHLPSDSDTTSSDET